MEMSIYRVCISDVLNTLVEGLKLCWSEPQILIYPYTSNIHVCMQVLGCIHDLDGLSF